MSHLNITYNPDYSSTPIREVCSIYITKNQAGERNKNVPNDNGYDFFFNWDSLHARLNSHYEAWSYKKEKKAQKRLQATENLFRKNLELKDVC